VVIARRSSIVLLKLQAHQIDPQRYLHYVLERIADHPINRIQELLPWNVVDQLNQPIQVAKALAA
jgi:IS66 C-terminal element